MIAAIVLGQVRDIGRFRTRAQFANYNGTAPIEASSANTNRHRLNMRGNRALNHAIHIIAVTQVAHDTPGRAYYLRRQLEGKTRKEALRALKRRVPTPSGDNFKSTQTPRIDSGPGTTPRGDSKSSAAG